MRLPEAFRTLHCRAATVALALALCGIYVAANGKHCRWMLDADGDQFERLMLADGYGGCAAGGTVALVNASVLCSERGACQGV